MEQRTGGVRPLFRISRRFNLMAGIILTLLVFFYAVGW